MNALETARKFAAVGANAEAVKAYKVALTEVKDQEPAAEMEAALYILQFGRRDDYKISYTCFKDLYNHGFAQDDILRVMDAAFYQPNVKAQRKHYEKNCRLLAKYPYIFRKDFPAFEELPIIFFPYDDNQYTPYFVEGQQFGEFFAPNNQVISRNFFKDLEQPILAADVFSQYELEYLNDNVRKSEYVARENHIYLHYTSWPVFCAYLQVWDWQPLLKEEKIVFLFEDEIELYPIDFKERFDIDYSQYSLRPIGIREINRLIWHTQLSSDNGGDYFNEVFDSHPNLLIMPSILFDRTVNIINDYESALKKANSLAEALQLISWKNKDLVASLYRLRNRKPKDIMVAMYLEEQMKTSPDLEKDSRIVPAIFFQPHFHNIFYNLQVNEKGQYLLYSEQYEQVVNAPLFEGFKYIKTFTPMRTITTSYAATVKYKCYGILNTERKIAAGNNEKISSMDDELMNRLLNRSFMIDWQNRLFKDCRLVRFEDAKLNVKATFTALAAFLDLPYTESMTYCSMYGRHDPLEDVGNEVGFSLGAIYRKNEEYANPAEKAFIEFGLRDVYKFYGYDFEYYDGQPVDEERLEKWLTEFTTIDKYIIQSRKKVNYFIAEKIIKNKEKEAGEALSEKNSKYVQEQIEDKLTDEFMEKQILAKRRLIGKILLQDNLRFINRKGQPLHMMPMLEPDPDLLVMPLYRSTTNPKIDIEVQEFSHEEMKPLEETD